MHPVFIVALYVVLTWFVMDWYDKLTIIWRTKPDGFADWALTIAVTVIPTAAVVLSYIGLLSL